MHIPSPGLLHSRCRLFSDSEKLDVALPTPSTLPGGGIRSQDVLSMYHPLQDFPLARGRMDNQSIHSNPPSNNRWWKIERSGGGACRLHLLERVSRVRRRLLVHCSALVAQATTKATSIGTFSTWNLWNRRHRRNFFLLDGEEKLVEASRVEARWEVEALCKEWEYPRSN